MDVLRKAFGDPFMELVHPAGRLGPVTEMGPQTGAADVDWLCVSFHLQDVYELEAVSPYLYTPTGDIKKQPILYPYAAPV